MTPVWYGALRVATGSRCIEDACVSCQSVGLGCHDEVVTVQTPDLVRPPGDGHFSPLGEQRGVMPFFLCELPDALAKGESLAKSRDAERAHQARHAVMILPFPLRDEGRQRNGF